MIENGLHWVLDRNFHDDECRVRTDHAPANFTIRLRHKVAAWDDDFLASLIAD
jgi:predicted transposase YbfD/YdcC